MMSKSFTQFCIVLYVSNFSLLLISRQHIKIFAVTRKFHQFSCYNCCRIETLKVNSHSAAAMEEWVRSVRL